MIKRYKKIVLVALAVITLIFPVGKASANNTSIFLRQFEILQIKNKQKLKLTDKLINKFTHSKVDTTNIKPVSLLRNIEQRKELLLRHEFISRILIQIESHYRGQNETDFLISRLGSMAETEAKSLEPHLVLLKFILNCKDVLINSPRYNTNPVELIDRYMNFTTISKLKTSALFYQEQDYSNGTDTYKAKTIAPDQIGEQLETKIKEQQLLNESDKLEELSEKPILFPESELINRRLKLKKQLQNNKPNIKEIAKPLKNAREIRPSDHAPIMDQEQFNNLFKGN